MTNYATLYLHIASAAAFLTSVIDRFGIWGPYGTVNVAWETWRIPQHMQRS
jgi:hypothetical protein